MGQGRLFKIVYHLLDKGRTTAPELAEKFEVSVRTIYRDLDAISAAGIPIYTVQGKGGGIFILPEFVLEKSLLTPQEKEQILMALQGLAAAEDSRTDELLTKLGGLFRVQGANWIEVDFSDWHKNTAGAELFDELKRAVFSCRRVSFSSPNSLAVAGKRIFSSLPSNCRASCKKPLWMPSWLVMRKFENQS